MSPSACKTTEVVSVVCSLSLSQLAQDVKGLEEQIVEIVNEAGREFYGKVFVVFQERWLRERVGQYRAQRWRAINQVTPFGLLRLPVRVVRRCDDGHYLTLSRLLGPKATRLLSPLVEKQALEAATGENYRPAAAELWRWLRVKVSAWLIWRCVQFHGAKLSEQLDRQWWPDRAQPRPAQVVVTEIDSTYLKRQQRDRPAEKTHHSFSHPSGTPLQWTGAALSQARLALSQTAKQALDLEHARAADLRTAASLAADAPFCKSRAAGDFE